MSTKNRNPQLGNASIFSGSQKGNSYKSLVSNGTRLYLGSENGFKWWNVLQYGAIGDGATNDTTAIQAVITGASAGDVVYFPPGTYLVDSLTLKKGVSMRGSGTRATTMKCNANSTKVFTFTAGAALDPDFYISNFRFESNSKTTCYGIYIDGVNSSTRITNISIQDIYMLGTFTSGIYMKYCANSFISKIFCYTCVKGITIDNCTDTNISDCMVQQGSGTGYDIIGGAGATDEGIRLISCSTNAQFNGLVVTGQDWGIATGCSFTSTAISGAAYGVPASLSSSNFWKFSDCEFAVGTSGSGTRTTTGFTSDSSCTQISISNSIIAVSNYGIILKGSLHTVTGNTFKNNLQPDIYLDSCTKSTIVGNVCDSTGVSWSILGAGTTNYNSVVANTTNGTVTSMGANSTSASNTVY